MSATDLTTDFQAAIDNSLGIRGKVAVVSGGSRGIGRAAVDCFARLGANVVVNYVSNEGAAAETAEAAENAGVKAIIGRADVSQLDEAQRLVDKTVDEFGRIDFLVCNAGIWESAPVEDMTEELWDRTIDLNLKGTWAMCRAAVPYMKKQRFGRIVI